MSATAATAAEPIVLRTMTAADAAQLTRCFERCYGETYVADSFYDPDRTAARLASGLLRSVVAVSDTDGIVGHMALTLRDADCLTADAGNTIVDPRYRGHHLAARLAADLVRLCRDSGLCGFHHYPTTAHEVMQKLAVQGGGIETGVLLGYIPADTRYVGLTTARPEGRLAVVAVYHPVAPAPRRLVFLPARYVDVIRGIYRDARLERDAHASRAQLRAAAARIEAHGDDRRGVLRIDVIAPGTDLAEQVDDAARRHPAPVVLVDVRLSTQDCGAAIDALRAHGFFFGAVLPEYAGGDVVRLQRVDGTVETRPPLGTPGARELLAFIARDRDATDRTCLRVPFH